MKFKDMPKLPLVLIAAMFVVGALVYPQLPARIPMHWGPSGQIDRWGTRSFLTVFFAPLTTLAVYVLMWLVPYLDPQRANLLRSKQVYSIALELLAGMMTIVFVGQLYASSNNALPMASIVEVATGVMLVVIGNYMGRVKRNWTMGVRTRWTLSDDTVWAKTNRLGGRMLMVAGLLAIVGAFLPPLVGVALIVLPLLVILPVIYIYSMNLYRQLHPDEMEPPEPGPLAEEIDAEPVPLLQPGDASAAHIDKLCPACGAENAPGNSECIACGKPLGPD
ncbi:MAG: SdpI family protein [Coriobacteriia bacterium]|nr:SdpI family protein [Coriobacteriia bacterium]